MNTDKTIEISMDRFAQLITAEDRMEMIRRMYQDPDIEAWDYTRIFQMMFGKTPQRQEDGEDVAE